MMFDCGVLKINAGLPPSAGGELFLGVRPEDISVVADGLAGTPFSVDAVEPVGAESYLYLRSGDLQIVSRCDRSAAVQQGSCVSVVLNRKKLHFFEGEAGRRII